MARLDRKLPQNADGEFFVDDTCIDCDTCRQVAPATYSRADDVAMSIVRAQPASDADRHRALMALVACPTASIGTVHKADARAAAEAFPELVAEDVYYCGYAAESSFGASSYLIRRPGGNVLVDSPRAAAPLLRRLEELGGVRYLFLTHRDDVADHAKLRRHLGCERILHVEDVSFGTGDVERKLVGDEPIRLDGDLVFIPVPGHTRGSCALLYRDRFLFTGDHVWGDEDRPRLSASRGVCWYSWPEQTRSMKRLLDFEFTWVLPGHERRFRTDSAAAMREELRRLIAWMERR